MNGALYACAEWLLASLPVDVAGRRVFDETLADWRREAASVRGPLAQMAFFVRALFSVLRSIAGVTFREVRLIRDSGIVPMVIALTAGYLVLQWFVTPPIQWRLSTRSLLLAQLPRFAFFMPIALLLAISFARRRTIPSLGLALAAVVTGIVLLGWAVPSANRIASQESWSAFVNSSVWSGKKVEGKRLDGLTTATGGWGRVGMAYPAPTFVNDATVVDLGRKIAGGPEAGGWSAIRWTSFFLAYLAVCLLIPAVGSVLRDSNSLLRVVIVAVTVVMLGLQGRFPDFVDGFSVTWWLGAYWIPVIWMMLCLITVTKRSSRATEPTPGSA